MVDQQKHQLTSDNIRIIRFIKFQGSCYTPLITAIGLHSATTEARPAPTTESIT